VEFDLVDSGDDFGGRVGEEDFEVFDAEVGDADVADFARGGKFLEFLPVKKRCVSGCCIFSLGDTAYRCVCIVAPVLTRS
jgi:hypothetical protein